MLVINDVANEKTSTSTNNKQDVKTFNIFPNAARCNSFTIIGNGILAIHSMPVHWAKDVHKDDRPGAGREKR